AYEILFGQRVELDADREAALELRDQVRGLGDVERAGGDEENMVGLDETVLGVDLRAFDDRQQVSLDAFAGDIGPAPAALAARDLVDLAQENDPRRLRALDRLAGDLAGIHEASFLLRLEDLARLGDGRLAPFLLAAEEPGEHLLDVDVHLLDALVRPDIDLRVSLVF